MTRRVASGGWPELRAARIADLRRFQEVMPGIYADKIAALEAGASVVLDSEQLFGAVFQISPALAQKYNYRSDPEGVRRFLLTATDELRRLPDAERTETA